MKLGPCVVPNCPAAGWRLVWMDVGDDDWRWTPVCYSHSPQEPVWIRPDLSGLAEVFDGRDSGERRRAEDEKAA